MKNCLLIVLIYLISSSFSIICGNPFGSKIKIEKPKEKVDTLKNLKFKGFFVLGAEQYGLVQIRAAEYEVKEGESVEGFRIKKITENKIWYLLNGKIQEAIVEYE